MEQQNDSVILISNDGEKIKILKKNLEFSKLAQTMIDMDPIETEFYFPLVNHKTANLIVDYLNHIQIQMSNHPFSLTTSDDLKKALTEWDYNFINSKENFPKTKDIVDFVIAAEYFDIEPLKIVLGEKLASIVISSSTEQLKELFPCLFESESENESENEN